MENIKDYLILGAILIPLLALALGAAKASRKQKEQALKNLEDVPFDSVSNEEQNYELRNLYQSQKERIQRSLDG